MGIYDRVKKWVDKILGVKILYEGISDYGLLKVYKERGTINLVSGAEFVQSSYRPGKKPIGSVWDYFLVAPLFAFDPNKVRTVCILGLGAGTAVKLLNEAYKIERIVGVEIDKKVVKLAKKFFDLNDENLEVVIKDAAEYIKETSEMFDLIIVDTFKGDEIDQRCSTFEFYTNLTKILKKEGIVLINRVNTKKHEKLNKKFLQDFPKLFVQVYSLAVGKNIFYFGLKKYQDKKTILDRIHNFDTETHIFEFLKKFDKKNLYRHITQPSIFLPYRWPDGQEQNRKRCKFLKRKP